ncbi:MAG: hypothetical protein AAF734_12210, partial [Bacteroidota bacterium]
LFQACKDKEEERRRKKRLAEWMAIDITADTKPSPEDSANIARDKEYVLYTINFWLTDSIAKYNQDYGYRWYLREDTSIVTEIVVDSIFYSPDSLKIFALTAFSYKGRVLVEEEEGTPEEYKDYTGREEDDFYDGRALIGFRDSLRQGWRLFPFNKVIGLKRSENLQKLLEGQKRYYFSDLADETDRVRRKYYLRYKYNVNDKHFWDKSPVWEKGLRVKGYYNFQTDHVFEPEDINDPYLDLSRYVLEEVYIAYPDSMMEKFGLYWD